MLPFTAENNGVLACKKALGLQYLSPYDFFAVSYVITSGVVVGHTGHTPYDHYLFLQNSV